MDRIDQSNLLNVKFAALWTNAEVALHNYVNKIIRERVPQKTLLGNDEIIVIGVFFLYLLQVYYYRQMTDLFWQLFSVEKGWTSVFSQWPLSSISSPKNMAMKKPLYLTDTITSPLANHIKDGKNKLYD